MKNINPVIDEFKKLNDVKAIVLSGSRTAKSSDEISIYISTQIKKLISANEQILQNFFPINLKLIIASLVREMNGFYAALTSK